MPAAQAKARIETWFVIPTVRDSDKKKHRATLWGLLRAELYEVAGADSWKWVILEELAPTKGSWKNPKTGKPVRDKSRKYTVVVLREKAEEIREVLFRAANSFDQQEILFMVLGVDRSVKRDPKKGFLKGDPEGG